MITSVVDKVELLGKDGQVISSETLADILRHVHRCRGIREKLVRLGDPRILSVFAEEGYVTAQDFSSRDVITTKLATKIKPYLASNYPMMNDVRFEVIDRDEGGVAVQVFLSRNQEPSMTIDVDTVATLEYDALLRQADKLAGISSLPMTVRYVEGKEKTETAMSSFEQLASFVEEIGRKQLSVQRYKGLGEMNAEQLWETTMNPEHRTLVRVSIEDDVDADDVFSTLMGDLVEPRREFIQENALNVRNLDV